MSPTTEKVKDDIGQLLREARKDRKLSQEAVAYRAGLEQSDVSKIERGLRRPSIESARKLATAVGLDESAFLFK